MKIKFSLLIITLLLFSCNEKKEDKIKYAANNEIEEEFDTKKFPILLEALVLKQNKSYMQAIQKFNDAESEYGPMMPIYLNRGVIYHELERPELACTDLKKAKNLGLTEEYGNKIIALSSKFDCAL
tara:strand:+ start:49 stop:426 length:378 start_codon:yes stop_codon:yes gene_type:complete